MRLIDDQGVVGGKLRIKRQLAQQNAVGHEFEAAIRAGAVIEADLASHGRPHPCAQLGGDAVGERAGGDAPRLGMADHAVRAAPGREAQLGQLRGLA